MVPDTTGHFLASDACRCRTSANSAIDGTERAEGDGRSGVSLMRNPRRDELGDLMQADRRAEQDRQHDRRADAEAAPHAFRQVALQHRLVRMQRIVIDGDDGAGRIFRDGLGDLEISEVLADADAVVAQLPAGDGIFVDDVGEVALLEAMPALAVAVDHLDLAHLGFRDHHLARRSTAIRARRAPAATCRRRQREAARAGRAASHRRTTADQAARLFPQRRLAISTPTPRPRVQRVRCGFTSPASAPARCRRRS